VTNSATMTSAYNVLPNVTRGSTTSDRWVGLRYLGTR